jgi:hypothetical protein
MLSFFGFGKKRKSRKVSRKGRKGSRKMTKMAKPPSRLLRICKKYHVKATTKRGGKRVYKSIKVLKKACIKKVKAAQKKAMRMAKKRSAFGRRRSTRRCGMAFGKARGRGRSRKVSKAAAMKAFRQFYKRHCAGTRGSRFGNGGNPELSASMGYQFCPSGMGGVLGANSTGLFPSPCTSMNAGQAMAESALALPTYSSSFGRRRRTRRTRKASFGRKKSSKRCRKVVRRRKPCRKVRRKPKCKTSCRRRRSSTAFGRRRRRRATTEFGRRRRRTRRV